jgi:hypothetical protein
MPISPICLPSSALYPTRRLFLVAGRLGGHGLAPSSQSDRNTSSKAERFDHAVTELCQTLLLAILDRVDEVISVLRPPNVSFYSSNVHHLMPVLHPSFERFGNDEVELLGLI